MVNNINILRNKKKLRHLSWDDKHKLGSQKIYVNKSLCPAYRKLMGKCNSLLKKGYITSFYTINGKLKINLNEEENAITISHQQDLLDKFGEDTMNQIDNEYKEKRRE